MGDDRCDLLCLDLPRAEEIRRSLDIAVAAVAAARAKALGDPTRLTIAMALREGQELCVCDLAAVTGMSESAVSHALRLLRAHRVVSVNRRGRMAFYRLDDGHVRMLLDLGLTHTGHTTAIHPEREGGR